MLIRKRNGKNLSKQQTLSYKAVFPPYATVKLQHFQTTQRSVVTHCLTRILMDIQDQPGDAKSNFFFGFP